jgi:molecular chaperone GrpE
MPKEEKSAQEEATISDGVAKSINESTLQNENENEGKENLQMSDNKYIDVLKLQVSQLKEEVKEEKDKALRALAELENFKRRNQQEVDTFKKYASEKVILEFLPILDSFVLACNHAGSETKDIQNVIDGFLLIQKQFETALEKSHVTVIEAEGKTFNPNLHQAISQEKRDDKDSGIVVKELQRGYTLHDRVIRPSLVVVSE